MAEMVDDKQVQPAPAASTAPKRDLFRIFSIVWIGVIGLSWGLTIAHLLSVAKWLGTPSLRLSRVTGYELAPGALAVGLLVGAAIVFLVLKKFGSRMAYTKPGLGRWVRLSAYGMVGSLTAFGCYAFYMSPSITSSWWKDVFGAAMVFGKALSLKPILFPALGLFATVMLVSHLLLNQDKWSEFLIETEGEIKKVSWPARKEYLGSSFVVVVVVAVVSIFLHFVDLGLSELMKRIGIGF